MSGRLLLAGALLLTCGVARSETIYSNFGTPGPDGTGGGYSLGGSLAPLPDSGFYAVAMAFVPTSNYSLDSIQLPVTGETSLPLTVELRDGQSAPGNLLERYSADVSGFRVLNLQSNSHPILQAGRQYWVVVIAPSGRGQWGWGRSRPSRRHCVRAQYFWHGLETLPHVAWPSRSLRVWNRRKHGARPDIEQLGAGPAGGAIGRAGMFRTAAEKQPPQRHGAGAIAHPPKRIKGMGRGRRPRPQQPAPPVRLHAATLSVHLPLSARFALPRRLDLVAMGSTACPKAAPGCGNSTNRRSIPSSARSPNPAPAPGPTAASPTCESEASG